MYVINFKTNLIFLIKPFLYMTKKVKTKTLISWELKEFLRWNKKYFSSFLKGFSYQNLSKTLQCAFKTNSIWVFPFFNFISLLKWSKQEIINKRRHEIHNARRIIVELKACLRHLPEVLLHGKFACSVRVNICRIKAVNLVILQKRSIIYIWWDRKFRRH